MVKGRNIGLVTFVGDISHHHILFDYYYSIVLVNASSFSVYRYDKYSTRKCFSNKLITYSVNDSLIPIKYVELLFAAPSIGSREYNNNEEARNLNEKIEVKAGGKEMPRQVWECIW